MSREIKFRVWHHTDNYMIESAQSIATILEKHLKGWGSGMQNGNYQLDGSEYSIMQYTGLKDKNGQEIYEGDILKYDDYHYRVYWWQEMATFQLENINGGMDDYFESANNNCMEVIGNIYENPELLKKATHD